MTKKNKLYFLFTILFFSLFGLLKFSYATILFSYDFKDKFLEKEKWETNSFAKNIKQNIASGYLELKGNIAGQNGEKSNYFFISNYPLKPPYKYEVSIKISFSGEPKKRLSEEEEYNLANSSLQKENKSGGTTSFTNTPLRPPAVFFGIKDKENKTVLIFKIESEEIYVQKTGITSSKNSDTLKKIKDIIEGKWYEYKIIYDAKNKTANFFIDDILVETISNLDISPLNIFFGVSGEEGLGTKKINFARFDNLTLELK